MQVRFENMPDGDPVLAGGIQIKLHIALRIHHDRLAFRSQHVGSMRQTSQVKLFEVHRASPLRSAPQKRMPVKTAALQTHKAA